MTLELTKWSNLAELVLVHNDFTLKQIRNHPFSYKYPQDTKNLCAFQKCSVFGAQTLPWDLMVYLPCLFFADLQSIRTYKDV